MRVVADTGELKVVELAPGEIHTLTKDDAGKTVWPKSQSQRA